MTALVQPPSVVRAPLLPRALCLLVLFLMAAAAVYGAAMAVHYMPDIHV